MVAIHYLSTCFYWQDQAIFKFASCSWVIWHLRDSMVAFIVSISPLLELVFYKASLPVSWAKKILFLISTNWKWIESSFYSPRTSLSMFLIVIVSLEPQAPTPVLTRSCCSDGRSESTCLWAGWFSSLTSAFFLLMMIQHTTKLWVFIPLNYEFSLLPKTFFIYIEFPIYGSLHFNWGSLNSGIDLHCDETIHH